MIDLARSVGDRLAGLCALLPQPWWALLVVYETLLVGQFLGEWMLIRRRGAPIADAKRAPLFWTGLRFWLLFQLPILNAGQWPTPDPGLAVPFVGIAMALAGGGLRLWAIEHMGKHFNYHTTPVHGSRLVTTGPYRFVRHPLYTGLVLLLAGVPLVLIGFRSCLIMVGIGAAVLTRRIPREERWMRELHGAEFEAWRARTRLLVPGLF